MEVLVRMQMGSAQDICLSKYRIAFFCVSGIPSVFEYTCCRRQHHSPPPPTSTARFSAPSCLAVGCRRRGLNAHSTVVLEWSGRDRRHSRRRQRCYRRPNSRRRRRRCSCQYARVSRLSVSARPRGRGERTDGRSALRAPERRLFGRLWRRYSEAHTSALQ